VLGNIVVDGLDEMFNGTKIATANGLSSDFRKPAFDLINPGAARRGKMQNVSRSAGKPVAHSGRLVSGQIIQHQVNGGYTREAAIRPNKHHRTGNDRIASSHSQENICQSQIPIGRQGSGSGSRSLQE